MAGNVSEMGRIDVLLVTGWPQGFRWHWDQLPMDLRKGKNDIVYVSPSLTLSGVLSAIRETLKLVSVSRRYDAILFHGNTAACFLFSLIKRLRLVRLPFTVLVEFNMREDDGTLRSSIKYAFLRFIFKAVDLIFPFSKLHADYLGYMLGIKSARIVPVREAVDYVPTSKYPAPHYNPGSYVVALGRTCRDYWTFQQAIRGRNDSIVVVTNANSVQHIQFPQTVTLYFDIPLGELLRVIAGAKYCVIPLKDTINPVGLRMLFFSMYLGKAVIITRTMAVSEYFPDDDVVLTVNPNDPVALATAMKALGSNPDDIVSLGRKARKFVDENLTSEWYVTMVYDIICERCDPCSVKNRQQRNECCEG